MRATTRPLRELALAIEPQPGTPGCGARLARLGLSRDSVPVDGYARTVPRPDPVALVGHGAAALGFAGPLEHHALRVTFATVDTAAAFAATWCARRGAVGDAASFAVPVEPAVEVGELARGALRAHTLNEVIPPMEAIQRMPDWLAARNYRPTVPLSEASWLRWRDGAPGEPGTVRVAWPPGLEPPAEPADEHDDEESTGMTEAVAGGITVHAGGWRTFVAPSVAPARYLAWVLESARGAWSPALRVPPMPDDCDAVMDDKDHQLAHLLAFRRRLVATERFMEEMVEWLLGPDSGIA